MTVPPDVFEPEPEPEPKPVPKNRRPPPPPKRSKKRPFKFFHNPNPDDGSPKEIDYLLREVEGVPVEKGFEALWRRFCVVGVGIGGNV